MKTKEKFYHEELLPYGNITKTFDYSDTINHLHYRTRTIEYMNYIYTVYMLNGSVKIIEKR